ILYGLNPTFQIARRTWPVVLAAAGAMLVNIAVSLWLSPRIGPLAFAWAQLAGYAAGALLIAIAAIVYAPIRVNMRDVLFIALATAAMVAVLWPMRSLTPGAGVLVAMIGAGVCVYGAILFATDAASLRTLLANVLSRRKMRTSA
ncbi:MAG: polysaccharide biosynthesis C-terminal domain-containing protein, partial [Beijerinckiaceae bacterium]